jgi:hypothetical protein
MHGINSFHALFENWLRRLSIMISQQYGNCKSLCCNRPLYWCIFLQLKPQQNIKELCHIELNNHYLVDYDLKWIHWIRHETTFCTNSEGSHHACRRETRSTPQDAWAEEYTSGKIKRRDETNYISHDYRKAKAMRCLGNLHILNRLLTMNANQTHRISKLGSFYWATSSLNHLINGRGGIERWDVDMNGHHAWRSGSRRTLPQPTPRGCTRTWRRANSSGLFMSRTMFFQDGERFVKKQWVPHPFFLHDMNNREMVIRTSTDVVQEQNAR